MKKLRCGVLAALVLGLHGLAAAEVVTFEFRGTVSYSTYLAAPGTPVVGRFSWDASAPTVVYNPGSYPCSIYQAPYTGAFSARVGEHTIGSDAVDVWVCNDTGSNIPDLLTVNGRAPVLDGTTFADGNLGLAMGSTSDAVFRDTSLPRHLEAVRFQDPTGLLTIGGTNEDMLLQFTIDSIRRIEPAE
jgi:hypothetical protein